MRKLVLSALILASAFQTALGERDGDWSYIVLNNEATLFEYTGSGVAITIPSSIDWIPVVKIGYDFHPVFPTHDPDGEVINTGVTSVVIPNSVTSIGVHAFRLCTSLTSVTIPDSVTSIGHGAFGGCTSLTSVTIPDSVTSIGVGVFQGCIRLTSITIPNSVTSISLALFNGCRALASVTIPNSVTSIEDNAFSSCSGLTTLTIPDSVTSIGDGAFRLCTNLASITIPNSVTSIGDNAFYMCDILQRVFLPARFETTYQNFGLTSAQVILYDASNLSPIYLAGQQSVIANPNTHNLYTTSQIQNMAVGDLVLTRQVSGGFTLNYDIEQSTDLQNWTTYQALSLPLTGLPTDKAFVRIKAKQ
jgi:hypothetical protein